MLEDSSLGLGGSTILKAATTAASTVSRIVDSSVVVLEPLVSTETEAVD